VLSDSEKRARYDQFGHAGVDPNYGGGGGYGGGFSGFGDMGDIFDSIFSGFGGGFSSRGASNANAPRRGGDVTNSIVIDFMEACQGVKKKMRVTHMVKCEQCSGTGADSNTTSTTCTECHGTGTIRVNQRTMFGTTISTQKTCTKCGGRGKIVTNPCTKCKGSGRYRNTTEIEINVPAGIDNGQVLRVSGQGDAGVNGGGNGDLNVAVTVRPHELFVRNGNDIYCEIPISYAQAVLGDKVTVPTIKGKVEYDIPEGTQSGTKFRLRGEGVKYLGRESYGDQYVTVVVEVPKKLTKTQKELLQKFDDSLEEKNQVKRKNFFEKLKRKLSE
jgi:molecular chaperone DnaJ